MARAEGVRRGEIMVGVRGRQVLQDLVSHGGNLGCHHVNHDLTQMFKRDPSGEVHGEEAGI